MPRAEGKPPSLIRPINNSHYEPGEPRIFAGTSLAALVFIGFDGMSILAEEVKNPRRNVLLASVLVARTLKVTGL